MEHVFTSFLVTKYQAGLTSEDDAKKAKRWVQKLLQEAQLLTVDELKLKQILIPVCMKDVKGNPYHWVLWCISFHTPIFFATTHSFAILLQTSTENWKVSLLGFKLHSLQ